MIIVRHYNSSLQTHPFTTKALSGGSDQFLSIGLICSLGDGIRQKFEISAKEQTEFNWRRMGIAWVMGTVFMTPFFHVNYKYILPTLLKRQFSEIDCSRLPFDTNNRYRAAFGKMFIDQTVCAAYLCCHYLMFINILEAGTVSKGIEAI